jgi:carbamate kinase
MVGYLLELELGNQLPFERPLATVLTIIEVDPNDPAFEEPTKFIGPVYSSEEAASLGQEKGWVFKPDGESYRRVVPSPRPQRIFELRQIEWLLERGCIVICAGGGGIPTMYKAGRCLVGAEAVIDKDHASALLAREINADRFLMATDVDAAYVDWGKDSQRAISRAHPVALGELASEFPEGSMGPKVAAACEFAEATGGVAVIGSLTDVPEMLAGSKGTVVTTAAHGIEFAR